MPKLDFQPEIESFRFPNSWQPTASELTDLVDTYLAIAEGRVGAGVASVLQVAPLIQGLWMFIPGAIKIWTDEWISDAGKGEFGNTGYCGGMAFATLDYWIANAVISRGSIPTRLEFDSLVPSATGSPEERQLREYIFQRMLDHLTANANTFIAWKFMLFAVYWLPLWMPVPFQFPGVAATLAGPSALGRWTRDEWRKIRDHITHSASPCVIGLVRDTLDISADHSVVCYGFEEHPGDRGSLYVYDPNHPWIPGFYPTHNRIDFSIDPVTNVLTATEIAYTEPPLFGKQHHVKGPGGGRRSPPTIPPPVVGFFVEDFSPRSDFPPGLVVSDSISYVASRPACEGADVTVSYAVRNTGFGASQMIRLGLHRRSDRTGTFTLGQGQDSSLFFTRFDITLRRGWNGMVAQVLLVFQDLETGVLREKAKEVDALPGITVGTGITAASARVCSPRSPRPPVPPPTWGNLPFLPPSFLRVAPEDVAAELIRIVQELTEGTDAHTSIRGSPAGSPGELAPQAERLELLSRKGFSSDPESVEGLALRIQETSRPIWLPEKQTRHGQQASPAWLEQLKGHSKSAPALAEGSRPSPAGASSEGCACDRVDGQGSAK